MCADMKSRLFRSYLVFDVDVFLRRGTVPSDSRADVNFIPVTFAYAHMVRMVLYFLCIIYARFLRSDVASL